MKTKNTRTLLLVSGAVFLAGNAVAQSGGWDSSFQKKYYIALGTGSSALTPRTEGTGFTIQEDTDTGGTVALGVDFSRRLSFELQYADLGRTQLVDTAAAISEIAYMETSLSGLYYLWNGFADDEYLDYDGLDLRAGLSFYGRVGFGGMENESTGNVVYSRANDVQMLAGLGLEYAFENGLGARAEYIRYDTDAEYAGVSLLYRFGGGAPAPSPADPELPVLPSPAPLATLPPPPPPAELPPLVPDENTSESMTNVNDSDGDGVEDDFDNCPDTLGGTPVNSSGCETFNGVIEGVNFLSGSDTLTEVARTALDDVVGTLEAFPDVQLSVEAHTDSQGVEEENLELSRLRALSVVRYLISQGIDINRLRARAYGESRPIADNSTRDGRQLNRRVEFRTQ